MSIQDYIRHDQKKRFLLFPKNEAGIALFLVLWVLTLLTVIVGEFCHAMRTEVKITRNFKEETEAYYIAVAGLNMAISELIKSRTGHPSLEENISEEDQIEWRINADIPEVPFGNGRFKVKIENESSKININRADRPLLTMMLDRFDLEDTEKEIIADSILDWRDRDKFHHVNGAEDEYYFSLPEPYECKDADFDSVDELLLVRGVTPEIFHGKLREMITVYADSDAAGSAKKKNRKGFNKININAAGPEMIGSLPLMTEELVKEIMLYRKEKDFKTLTELFPILGAEVYNAAVPYLTLKSSSFHTIRSVGMSGEGNIRRGVEALIEIDMKSDKKYRIVKWMDNFGT